MSLENATSVDQRLAAARQLLAARPELFARQGAVIAAWRTRAGRRVGPYYALRYRDAGRQQSLYLGASPELADRVRRLLDEAQQPRRERLSLRRARAAVRASLRRHKHKWRRDLERLGLTLKGFEIRRFPGSVPHFSPLKTGTDPLAPGSGLFSPQKSGPDPLVITTTARRTRRRADKTTADDADFADPEQPQKKLASPAGRNRQN